MTFENLALKTIFHFIKSFLTRNIVHPTPQRQVSVTGTQDPPDIHFFLIPPPLFSKFETEGCPPPPAERGGLTLWRTYANVLVGELRGMLMLLMNTDVPSQVTSPINPKSCFIVWVKATPVLQSCLNRPTFQAKYLRQKNNNKNNIIIIIIILTSFSNESFIFFWKDNFLRIWVK